MNGWTIYLIILNVFALALIGFTLWYFLVRERPRSYDEEELSIIERYQVTRDE